MASQRLPITITVHPRQGPVTEVFRNVADYHIETLGVLHMTLINGTKVIVKDYYQLRIEKDPS